MVEIEIDGQKYEAPQGAMIIEVADANNIHIPRFCYHKKLSVAANCRMCLVEVEKAPKTVPACATPVTPGMKIFTKSQKTLDSQRAVMEFLLINHPLDCPICDQGGECELQDNALGYGAGSSPYKESKRVVEDKDIGPLVMTNLTRCIQCTRCVRFGQEVAGFRELGMIQRGEDSEIRTFVEKSLSSEISANIIDLCPVGALTSKPFQFAARSWELSQFESIACHDALGSNIYLHTLNNKVMRTVPKENDTINEPWLSDRDRFSYLGLRHQDRLLSPMIKQKGQWIATDWETALQQVSQRFLAIKKNRGPESLCALSSPNATQEEYMLLSAYWENLGSKNYTFQLRGPQEIPPRFDLSLPEVEAQKSILIVGSDLSTEIPLLALRFRKAALNGAAIHAMNVADFRLNFTCASKILVTPQQLADNLAAILKALLEANTAHPLSTLMDLPRMKQITASKEHRDIAQQLLAEKASFIYLGALAEQSLEARSLRLLAMAVAELTQSTLGVYSDGANTSGLAEIHAKRSNPYRHAQALLQEKAPKAILLHHLEPELDMANPAFVVPLLKQAEYIVALTSFKSEALMDMADVLLPIASLGETSGTFVNMTGVPQSFKGAVPPQGEARPAWKVFRVLATLSQTPNVTYDDSQEVLQALQQLSTPTTTQLDLVNELKNTWGISPAAPLAEGEFYRLTQWPLYRVDGLVRRASSLQTSGAALKLGVYLNENMLKKLAFTEGETICIRQSGVGYLPVYINNQLPDTVALIPAGFTETSMLGSNTAKLLLTKI